MEEELSRDQELQGKRKSSYVVNMLAALVLVLIIVAGIARVGEERGSIAE